MALTVAAIGPAVFGRPARLWLFGLASPVFLLALLWPKALGPLNRAVRTLAGVVGFLLQQASLLVLFFLVLTPVGLLARLVGRDVMGSQFRASSKSYWLRRPPLDSIGEDLRRPH